MQETEHRSFNKADEVREFPRGRAEILNIGDAEVVGDESVVVDWFGASNYAE